MPVSTRRELTAAQIEQDRYGTRTHIGSGNVGQSVVVQILNQQRDGTVSRCQTPFQKTTVGLLGGGAQVVLKTLSNSCVFKCPFLF